MWELLKGLIAKLGKEIAFQMFLFLLSLLTATYFSVSWVGSLLSGASPPHGTLSSSASWGLQLNADFTFRTSHSGLSGPPYRDSSAVRHISGLSIFPEAWRKIPQPLIYVSLMLKSELLWLELLNSSAFL